MTPPVLRPSAPIRAVLALAVALLWTGGATGVWAQRAAPGALLRVEATLPGDEAADAVAINADESILARATVKDGVAHVALYDRPSRTLLGNLNATVGDQPRLRFAPDQDLLIVAGSKAVQLWEVPVAPLKPDQVLPESYRRWEQPLEKGDLADVRFGDPPDSIYWSQGGALYRRGTARTSAAPAKALWPTGDRALTVQSLRFGRGGSGIAVQYAGEKDVDLLDARAPSLLGTLSGHRFPVLAAAQLQGRNWISLDQGGNLIRWSDALQQQSLTHLDGLPKDLRAAALAPLGARHVLLTGAAGGGVQALVLNPATWKSEDEIHAAGPEQLAVSPTGRYLLVADGKAVRLLGFAQPEAPSDYLRRLRELKAAKTAQTYVRMLDDSGMPSRTKATLAAELNRAPPGAALQDALERLAAARKEGSRENTRHWAEQVLNLQPRQPDALAALQELKLAGDRAVLEQARQALQTDRPTEAISLLTTQISPDSALKGDAAALIKQAEGRRGIDITLEQAREKLNLGEYPAATALVEQVLRQDATHPAALGLRDEIQERTTGATGRNWWPAILGGLLAAGIMAFVWQRYQARRQSGSAAWQASGPPPGLSGAGPRPRPEPPPGPPPVRPRPAQRPAPAAPRNQRAEVPVAERRSTARLQVIENAQEKVEDLLRLARLADLSREHTSYFMGLEAELSALRRRVGDPASDLGAVHARLKAIADELRNLKFSDPPAEPPPPEPPPEPGAADSATWYEVLQVDVTATDGEIKAAYHRLLKQYHPDLHNASAFGWVKDEAERMSRRIGQAYEVLGHPERRREYDRHLAREGNGNGWRRQGGARE